METVTQVMSAIRPQQSGQKQPSMRSSDQDRQTLLKESLSQLTSWRLIPTPTPDMLRDWLLALQDIPDDAIRLGTDKARHIGTNYFTLPVFIELCKVQPEDLGLPITEAAYHEACCAQEVRRHKWSHPAVFHAGADVGWFDLRNGVADSKRRFSDAYARRVAQVMAGELLAVPGCELLPERVRVRLTPEQRKAKLQQLRAETGL